jgi:hypothetical protein
MSFVFKGLIVELREELKTPANHAVREYMKMDLWI